MNEKGVWSIELEKERIIDILDQIRRNARNMLADIDTALLKTGDALLFNMTGSDENKDIMIVHNSTLMKEEKELVENIVEMTDILAAFLVKPYKPGMFTQPNIIPTHFNHLSTHWEFLSTGFPMYTATAEQLALLTRYNTSDSTVTVETCCNVVKGVCQLERETITKNQWASLPRDKHPDGIIGHVYDVLLAYEEKCVQEEVQDSTSYIAERFRSTFEPRCDSLLTRARVLWEEAGRCSQGECALTCLCKALDLISKENGDDSALKLVKDVKVFLESS
ncbi:MAG: hypothetical protein HXS44_07510 [Theionarchaea archaeon]|nr:hypothetical protein [Theionarchaea archaeon]